MTKTLGRLAIIAVIGTTLAQAEARTTIRAPISCEEAATAENVLCAGCIGDPSPHGCCTDDLNDPACCANFCDDFCADWGGTKTANGCGGPGAGGSCCCDCDSVSYPFGYYCDMSENPDIQVDPGCPLYTDDPAPSPSRK